MNLQELIKQAQELTQHTYTKAELKKIYKTINEIKATVGQPKWAIEDETERDELREMVINYALVEYYRSTNGLQQSK